MASPPPMRLYSDNVGIIFDNPLTEFRGPVQFDSTITNVGSGTLANFFYASTTAQNTPDGIATTMDWIGATTNNQYWHSTGLIGVGGNYINIPTDGVYIIDWTVSFTGVVTGDIYRSYFYINVGGPDILVKVFGQTNDAPVAGFIWGTSFINYFLAGQRLLWKVVPTLTGAPHVPVGTLNIRITKI